MAEDRQERRKSDIDPKTGEFITPIKVRDRLARLETVHRRHQTENRVMYAIAVLLAAGGAFLYDRIQSERADRITDQSDTNQIICRGQARTLTNSIDSARNDRLNAKLQLAILLNSTTAKSNPAIAPAIRSIREIRRNAQKIEDRSIAQLTAIKVNPAEVRHDNGFKCELPSNDDDLPG